jgi:hypothetical protein
MITKGQQNIFIWFRPEVSRDSERKKEEGGRILECHKIVQDNIRQENARIMECNRAEYLAEYWTGRWHKRLEGRLPTIRKYDNILLGRSTTEYWKGGY